MANLKSLVKDTAIYGISSIAGRFINYLLVPIQTAAFAAGGGEYGVVTNIYAYTALLMVILTYGMETTFFRFINKTEDDPMRVYSTVLVSVGVSSLLFVIAVFALLPQIAGFMKYPDHPDWVAVMFVCVAIDAFKCIPFAYLRYQKRAIKFACLQLVNIILNIILNLTYLIVLPALRLNPFGLYDDKFTLNVGMVFYINLVCTAVVVVCFWHELTGFRYRFDRALWGKMMRYAWPLLILGIAGILNQTLDKIIFPYLYTGADEKAQLGIYGAATKIAMIMAMITQAFRYAYEPFVFGKAKDRDSRDTYAKAMKYFVIFTLLAFLAVIGYMDILRYVIRDRSYWPGLRVVPIVMAAEIMMGIYFNLSFWYKLIDKTIYGAWFSGAGCLVLVVVNVVFVPRYSYMACAWGGVAGYGTAMLLSYFVGQKKYPIRYDLKSIGRYVLLAAVLYVAAEYVPIENLWLRLGWRTVLLLVFAAYIVKHDLPLSRIPLLNRLVTKK